MTQKKTTFAVLGLTVLMKKMKRETVVTAKALLRQIPLSSLFRQVNSHWLNNFTVRTTKK